MSVDAFTQFLDSNPEVAKQVAACQNYNEVAEIAKANGINVSGAELTKYAAEQTAELSDEALEAVAGGQWTQPSGGGMQGTILDPTAVVGSPGQFPGGISLTIIAK